MNEPNRSNIIGLSFFNPVLRAFRLPKIAKRTAYLFILSVLLAFFGKPPFAGSEEKAVTPVSVLKFAAGMATSMLIHEGAHGLVAGVTDTHMTWKLGTYNQPFGFTEHADSDAKGVAVYSAGLVSQAITAEILLQTDRVDKNDAYVRGMMTWSILNPVLYSLDYWIFHVSNKKDGNSYQGDLTGIEHYSNKATAEGFAASMTAIALYQGYRFLRTQSWAPDWLKKEKNRVLLAPAPSGGFVACYHFSF